MTADEALKELQLELRLHERITELLVRVADDEQLKRLKKSFVAGDLPHTLIARNTHNAEGIGQFIKLIISKETR